mmetsp:Transcript_52248/g.77941  ORF Transcript_52248/g.77941 Transcript_52248/m.77941 type:complete len:93 (+) Transcript_52248:824-1102(+)
MSHLKVAIIQMHSFNSQGKEKYTRADRMAGQKAKNKKFERVLTDTTSDMSPDWAREIQRGQKCGQWLNILLRYKNNTVLGVQELRDSLLLHY